MTKENCKILVPTLIFVAMRASGLHGFEVQTHTKLSEKATDSSRLNQFLTTTLPFEFPRGTGEEIGQGEFKTVKQLIADVGAVNEDKPDIRSRTHFHDPTNAWAQAGLTSPYTGTFQSSILWSQNLNQDPGGKHSWQDARNSYFNALTATITADRRKYYSETFESLGHLIHLVQDTATPAHTRNDWHLGLTTGNRTFPFLNVDRFHQWANVRGAGAINSAGSLAFDSSILNQTYSGLVPIAGIIDTTTTAGSATPSDATNIGIAEYSNANFFSDDTILKNYAYPNTTQMDLTEEPGPDGPETRFYLRKSFGPGPIGYRAAVSTLLAPVLPFGFPTHQWELDDNVMDDYGALLFPRAIGYSAGLIDYFFRGKIDSTPWSPGYVLVPWSARPSSIVVENVSVKVDETNEQGGQGTMRLVLLYRYKHVDTPAGAAEVVVSQPVSVSASSSPQTIVFAFDSLPFPLTHPSVSGSHIYGYSGIVVYKGALGQESEAVVGAGYCVNPNNGSRYDRVYQFEHSVPGLWFEEDTAYIDYFGC